MADGSSFAVLTQAFNDRLSELKRFAYLRVEDGAKDQFHQDLTGLEANVTALEQHVASLKQLMERELAAVTKVQALVEATKLQGDHLQVISSNLPTRLPGQPMATLTGSSSVIGVDARQSANAAAGPSSISQGFKAEISKARKEAPRWYVTERELSALSSYMRGRLSLDKVNAALDELVQHAEANSRLVQAARAGGAKLAPADRKRATELLHSVANKDGIKGSFWFLEPDLKDGREVKLDKSGKGLLTVFRHLGRLHEVRLSIDGTTTTVYIFQDPAPAAGNA